MVWPTLSAGMYVAENVTIFRLTAASPCGLYAADAVNDGRSHQESNGDAKKDLVTSHLKC